MTATPTPAAATPPPKERLSPRARREARTFYFTVSPWIIGFLVFTLGPLVFSLYVSFTRWNILTPPEFIGIDNYTRMFNDPDFWQALKVTSIYAVVSVPLRMSVALLLAILLNQATRAVGFFRTSFYLPAVVASTAAAVIWQWLFNPRFGPINQFIELFGVKGPAWFNDPDWALRGLIIMSVWGVGGEMLIFFAGLKGIPKTLYEAAEVDGAGTVQQFWNITIPMLTPTIFFNLIMAIIGAFQTFDAAFVISTARSGAIGSPAKSTLFLMLKLYQEAFSFLNMGYASAIAWVMFAIIFVVTILVNWSSGRWVYSE
jgi:multiple sugar transport system permease protein